MEGSKQATKTSFSPAWLCVDGKFTKDIHFNARLFLFRRPVSSPVPLIPFKLGSTFVSWVWPGGDSDYSGDSCCNSPKANSCVSSYACWQAVPCKKRVVCYVVS